MNTNCPAFKFALLAMSTIKKTWGTNVQEEVIFLLSLVSLADFPILKAAIGNLMKYTVTLSKLGRKHLR